MLHVGSKGGPIDPIFIRGHVIVPRKNRKWSGGAPMVQFSKMHPRTCGNGETDEGGGHFEGALPLNFPDSVKANSIQSPLNSPRASPPPSPAGFSLFRLLLHHKQLAGVGPHGVVLRSRILPLCVHSLGPYFYCYFEWSLRIAMRSFSGYLSPLERYRGRIAC